MDWKSTVDYKLRGQFWARITLGCINHNTEGRFLLFLSGIILVIFIFNFMVSSRQNSKMGMIRISLSWDDQKAFWVVLSRVGLTLTGLHPINLSRKNNTFQLLFGMSFKYWLNCHTRRYQTLMCLFWCASSPSRLHNP